MSKGRVDRVRVALAGFEIGDRVVVFRDTKSTLGGMFTAYPGGLSGVIVNTEAPSDDGRYFVNFDTGGARWGGCWWVHPDDMRLE